MPDEHGGSPKQPPFTGDTAPAPPVEAPYTDERRRLSDARPSPNRDPSLQDGDAGALTFDDDGNLRSAGDKQKRP